MRIVSEVYGKPEKDSHGLTSYLYEVVVEINGRKFAASHRIDAFRHLPDMHKHLKSAVQRDIMEHIRQELFSAL
ncbi:hypothetical protein [Aeromonas enteropelogenes]|uniref:hypothetical protein n=1 Tax=Aeromonas enteropelogenes TaxID=29489 RepID=UPI001CBEC24F|nr:hypothetical protein [Aeromonas enteropelogenes]UAK70949.1 hypothetical protein K8O95_14880 [Aeromonas enteropelogenes]